MDSFVPALYLNPRTIIKMEHKTSYYREPRVNAYLNSHEMDNPRDFVFPIYFVHYPHHLTHFFSKL